MDYESRRFVVQCCFRGGAFPSGGHVGPSFPKVVVPVVRVSLCMLFVSQLGDCQAVEAGRVQKVFIGQRGQALGTIGIKYLWCYLLHVLSPASMYWEYSSVWSYYSY